MGMFPKSQSLKHSYWRWHVYPKEGTRSKRIDSNIKTGGMAGEWDTKTREPESLYIQVNLTPVVFWLHTSFLRYFTAT